MEQTENQECYQCKERQRQRETESEETETKRDREKSDYIQVEYGKLEPKENKSSHDWVIYR